MKTAVVILNWNTAEYLRRFVPALLSSLEGRDAELVVADNGSEDGSIDLMNSEFPQVRTIALGQNYGFTGGYNRALEQLEAEYFVLINSDIEVPEDWLDPLVSWMDAHPQCGACGPKLLSWNERERFEYAGAAGGYIDRYGFPYCRGRVLGRTEKDSGQYDTPARVMWVSGACLMVRSALWKELGGLDERFFAHMEEIDLCWRMALRGREVWCVPASKVWHIGGGTLPQGSPRKLELNFRNSLLMLEKNLPLTIGPSRARRRLFVRRCIDRIMQLAYLLTLRPSLARAVGSAHRQWHELRADGGGLRPAHVRATRYPSQQSWAPPVHESRATTQCGPQTTAAGRSEIEGFKQARLVFFEYICTIIH